MTHYREAIVDLLVVLAGCQAASPASTGGGDADVEIVPRDRFQNRNADGTVDRFDPYNYSHPYSAGWDGDRLVAYENDDGETASVWTLTFDSRGDDDEFVTGYQRVRDYRGAERVDGHRKVWTIAGDRPFADAFAVRRAGDTGLVVSAPTVKDLGEVRDGLRP